MSGESYGDAPQPVVRAEALVASGLPADVAAHTAQYAEDWTSRAQVADAASLPALVAELELHMSAGEIEIPGGAWDMARGTIARRVYMAGLHDLSYDVANTIRSPHATANVIMWYMNTDPNSSGAVFAGRGSYHTDPAKARRVIQAFYDLCVYANPDHPSAMKALERLALATPEGYDPVGAWITSTAVLYDDPSWEALAAVAGRPIWGDVPLPNRQHLLMHLYELDAADQDDKGAAAFVESLHTQVERFPDCGALEGVQYRGALALLETGRLELALDLVRSITDEELLNDLAEVFAEYGVDIWTARTAPLLDNPEA